MTLFPYVHPLNVLYDEEPEEPPINEEDFIDREEDPGDEYPFDESIRDPDTSG